MTLIYELGLDRVKMNIVRNIYIGGHFVLKLLSEHTHRHTHTLAHTQRTDCITRPLRRSVTGYWFTSHSTQNWSFQIYPS